MYVIVFRTKSESPSSSISSATPVPAAAHLASSQQIASNQQQTSNTTYGFQLREDQGKKFHSVLNDKINDFLPKTDLSMNYTYNIYIFMAITS